jgi:uncharacterized protein involved in response to NO
MQPPPKLVQSHPAPAPGGVAEPYGPFFLLGATLAWAGVLHWLLFSLGVLPHGHGSFHGLVQIQGFLMCFALGFLLTAIPRRTGTPGPSALQMALGLVCPVGFTVAAWYERWALAQACWVALVLVLIGFVVPRFRRATAVGRPPGSFVWVPLSLVMGLAGALLVLFVPPWHPAYLAGRGLLLQGMFLGLVVGVGAMLLPMITRGESTPPAPVSRSAVAGHALGAALLAGSLVLTAYVPRPGFALTAVLALVLLVRGARIHRLPSLPGAHRWLVWLAAWMIPLGYLLAALAPGHWQAGLHVVFVGGFALMAFAVAVHVVLAHGGDPARLHESPWQVVGFGGLFLVALLARVAAQWQVEHFTTWLGVAAATFLLGTLLWATLLVPVLLRSRGGPER